jgi:hypothetical protein
MPKLLDEQVKKTEMLIFGLRKNKHVLARLDMDEEVINELEAENRALETDNQELEQLKTELKEKSRKANLRLHAIRETFMLVKGKVKRSTHAEIWKDLGIMDKK